METAINGIGHIKKGINTGEIVGFTMGVILFAVSLYAFGLSIKANKMTIDKLTEENNLKKKV